MSARTWAAVLERFSAHLDDVERALDAGKDPSRVARYEPTEPDEGPAPEEALRAVELLTRSRELAARVSGALDGVRGDLDELAQRRRAGNAYLRQSG